MTDSRCGYVAILGRPNVGKSTLLNHILKQKLAITSRKPQTTRHNLLGIDTQEHMQALYIDTPGIHAAQGKASRAINSYMVRVAKSVIPDVDVRVVVLEAGKATDEDDALLNLIAQVPGPHIAVLNKVDLLADKTALLPQIERLAQRGLFAEIVPLSALKSDGIDELRQIIFGYLPVGQHLYHEDEVTDRSVRHLVQEIVREKLMRQLGDEVPHSASVLVEAFDESLPKTLIHAAIYIERDSQKRIVIGQQGQRLKSIGQEARIDIERLLGKGVVLKLWVKVRKGWTNKPSALKELGYE